MPRLTRGPAERELQRLIELFLQAETDIINEIGRLRSLGLADYHAEAALERVQAIREAGVRMKDAVRQVAAATGLSRNELYDAVLKA